MICIDQDINFSYSLSTRCRLLGVPFFYACSMGFEAFFFEDLGESFIVYPKEEKAEDSTKLAKDFSTQTNSEDKDNNNVNQNNTHSLKKAEENKKEDKAIVIDDSDSDEEEIKKEKENKESHNEKSVSSSSCNACCSIDDDSDDDIIIIQPPPSKTNEKEENEINNEKKEKKEEEIIHKKRNVSSPEIISYPSFSDAWIIRTSSSSSSSSAFSSKRKPWLKEAKERLDQIRGIYFIFIYNLIITILFLYDFILIFNYFILLIFYFFQKMIQNSSKVNYQKINQSLFLFLKRHSLLFVALLVQFLLKK